MDSPSYFWHPALLQFQPERRQTSAAPVTPKPRTVEPLRTAFGQYEFLQACLVRRETLNGELARKTRNTTHIVCALCLLYFIMYFGAQPFVLYGEAFGTAATLSIGQISAAMPLLLAYLVLYQCSLTARRTRIRHECLVLGLALERFGCQTSYTMMRIYKKQCKDRRSRFRAYLNESYPREGKRLLYRSGAHLYDAFCAMAGGITLLCSLLVAFPLAQQIRRDHPVVAWTFFVLLAAAATAATVAPALMMLGQRSKNGFCEGFAAWVVKNPLVLYPRNPIVAGEAPGVGAYNCLACKRQVIVNHGDAQLADCSGCAGIVFEQALVVS